MRIVVKKERKQRGCKYCLDYAGAKRCPRAKCPYIELDRYEDYEEYFAESDRDLKQLFKDIFKLDEGRLKWKNQKALHTGSRTTEGRTRQNSYVQDVAVLCTMCNEQDTHDGLKTVRTNFARIAGYILNRKENNKCTL